MWELTVGKPWVSQWNEAMAVYVLQMVAESSTLNSCFGCRSPHQCVSKSRERAKTSGLVILSISRSWPWSECGNNSPSNDINSLPLICISWVSKWELMCCTTSASRYSWHALVLSTWEWQLACCCNTYIFPGENQCGAEFLPSFTRYSN